MAPEVVENRYAVVDIGTNSVRLLVCDVDSERGTFATVTDVGQITRLGEGLDRTGRLGRAAVDRTCTAVHQFLMETRRLGVREVVGVGTSAVREAEDAEDFLNLTHNQFGLEIEAITGEEEARLTYLGITSDEDAARPVAGGIAVFDIGAGSTELAFGHRTVDEYHGLNIGAVRLTERHLGHDPPTDGEVASLRAEVRAILDEEAPPSVSIYDGGLRAIGCGGTVENLGRVKLALPEPNRAQLHGVSISRDDVRDQLELFRRIDTNERVAIPGLEPRRADIIIAGAVITDEILAHTKQAELSISTRGLRHGVIRERFVEPRLGSRDGRAPAVKTILAMRHAKSSWSDDTIPDHDRPLNQRGLRDAPRMGDLLREEGLSPEAIVTSTANRALATAHAVAHTSGFTGEVVESSELYGATAASIRAVLNRTDDRVDRVLVVCHNPGIDRFVTTLAQEPVAMKTATIAHIEVPIDVWADLDKHVEGRLVAVWRPKDLS